MIKFCEAYQTHKDKACSENLYPHLDFIDGDKLAGSAHPSCDLIYEKKAENILIELKGYDWFLFVGDKQKEIELEDKINKMSGKISGSLKTVPKKNKNTFVLGFNKKVGFPNPKGLKKIQERNER